MSLIMDPLNLLTSKQIMGKQSSAQMVEQISGIETAVIAGPSRTVLYFPSWSKGEISAVIKDGWEWAMC